MSTLFLRYGLKHHLAHKFRLAMVLLSLSLGVAIFVSSYESVMAAQVAIIGSANAMSGKAEWEVSRGQNIGVEDSLLGRIRRVPGAVAAPIVEVTASTAGPHPVNFLIIGLDLDSDATRQLFGSSLDADAMQFVKLRLSGSGILVARSFAKGHGLSEGSRLILESATGRRDLGVVGVLASKELDAEASGSVCFMEIQEAQRDFGRPGTVDKIEVAGTSKSQLSAICATCQVQRPGKLGSAAEDALTRIRSLLGISMIALLVGVLLIYNSVQVSVLERLQDIAILRSIGTTRIQILSLLLAEWCGIGLVGSCLGIAIGSGLADALVEYTKRTVNTMVPLVADARVRVEPALVIAALAIGVGTSVAAAYFPARAAADVRPLEILRPHSYRQSHRYRAGAIIGLSIFLAASLTVATQSVSYVIGLSVTGVEFFGIALLFPQVVLVLGNRLRAGLRGLRDPAPYLALDSLLKAPHRTAFTMMTFGCALMMMIATETLVAGFEASTGIWMNAAFPFDISVMGNDLASSVYGSQVLPASLVGKLRTLPGVSQAYAVRKLFTPFRGNDVMAIGIETDQYLAARRSKGMGMWPPELQDRAVESLFRSGRGIFVSSNFAELYRVQPGAVLRLDTPSGAVELKVLGQVDDYSWQHGAFILDLASLDKRWKVDSVSYVDIAVASGHTVPEVKERVQSVATGERIAFAYDKAEIKEATDSVIEQSVAMANLQAALAVVIGVLGMVNAIWIGVMNRRREIALWRAIGVTRGQVGRIVLYEGFFVAMVAALVGAVAGLYGGWVPLRSFSFDVTGYEYPRVVPWADVFAVTALALVLGLFAGAFPARQAAKLPILDSIGYE